MDLRYLRASDGNGPAAPATVTTARSPGATLLNVDAVTNWPERFIATSGVYDEERETLDVSTIQVFLGHVDGSKIVIDSLVPGFVDNGNSVGEKIFIKPATDLMNMLVDFLGVSHKNDGSIKQVDGAAPGLVFSAAATEPDPDPDGRTIVWFKPL